MKFAPSLLVAFALVLFAGTAGAQLKLPRNAPAARGTRRGARTSPGRVCR